MRQCSKAELNLDWVTSEFILWVL